MDSDFDHDPDLMAIDEALLRLRRFLQTPATVVDGGRSVELSTLLVVGAVAAAPDGAASVGQVAAVLEVAPSTASRLVGRAEANGMVVRTSGWDDARQSVLRLTPDGVALHRRAQAFRHGRLSSAVAAFTPAEKRRFAQLLSRFADGATRSDTPEPPAQS
ncbi:MarR family transcriptional regulator [Micromonospora sp. NPDC126480]|uniref:MarR family winged helix-turn-helix transcriptional regulator n=1 Tax=Micromonospora sp. NPDC126480 TaxID=3155312 RepID=UPI00332B8F91